MAQKKDSKGRNLKANEDQGSDDQGESGNCSRRYYPGRSPEDPVRS